MDQTLAQSPPTSWIQDTESVPAILNVDDEKTLVKTFDETIIKKG